MLKVALRGLDRVGRDNPAPGEVKPRDMVGGGGAGSCLWQHCGGGLPGCLGVLMSLGGCGSRFGLALLQLEESRIAAAQVLVSSLQDCKGNPHPPWKVPGLCPDAPCAARGGCKPSQKEGLTPWATGSGLRVSLATRAGAPGVANADLLWLGSAARKTATLAGREPRECLCVCSAPLPFPVLQRIENVLRQIIPVSQPSPAGLLHQS